MNCQYIAQPQSRIKIRKFTEEIRKKVGCDNQFFFPILRLLDVMPTIYEDVGFEYEIVDDDVLTPSVQGDMDILNNYMRIKQSVYDGAYKGKGRDRYSIAHEVGHFLLTNVAGVGLQRNLQNSYVRICEDPEWQAEVFAGELLIPMRLVKGMSPEEIVEHCKVSLSAAKTQIRCSYNKTRLWREQ